MDYKICLFFYTEAMLKIIVKLILKNYSDFMLHHVFGFPTLP